MLCFWHLFLILKSIFVILILTPQETLSKSFRMDDICGEMNGRRIYLELGEEGTIIAKRENIYRNYTKLLSKQDSFSNKECSLELITCPSCIIRLKFVYLNLTKNCGNISVLDGCGCDYVWVNEPPYEDVSGKQYCGHFMGNNSSLVYNSQTRNVAIIFMNVNMHDHAFTLEYHTERNRQFFQSYTRLPIDNGSQIITSPFFPHLYPRDLSMEYIINCTISIACRIRIIFTDFQIAATSFIEFFDNNRERMYVTTGSVFRPPIVISSGPTIFIRFYANGGTNYGYKAKYSFLLDESDELLMNTDGDCGGNVDNLGGGITMMNMVSEGVKAFDCYWIIKPPESFVHLKTHLYLKVVKYLNFAGHTELVIKQGSTSYEPLLETLRYPLSHFHAWKEKEHIVPISQGFYVSLRGVFNANSSLALMYSAFNYKECYSGTEFLCQNHRCIPSYLSCDGYDHCGDNSDEIIDCKKESKDRKWAHRSNFYFPKLDRDADLRTATLVFIVCSVGLIALIFALIALLYRVNTRARTQMQIQTHLQTINDLIEEGSQNRVEEEIIDLVDDVPPTYEGPPEYEDVVKILRRKENHHARRLSNGRGHRDRHCPRCARHHRGPTSITSDEIGESSINSEASSISNINIEGFNKSCQTTPVPQVVPESPPPPYMAVRLTYNEESEENICLELPSCSIYNSAAHRELNRKIDRDILKNLLLKDTGTAYKNLILKRRQQRLCNSFSETELDIFFNNLADEDKPRRFKLLKLQRSFSDECLVL